MSPDSSPIPAEATIAVRDLVTHYGQRKILDGINLDIRRG